MGYEISVLLSLAALQLVAVLIPTAWTRRHCGLLRSLVCSVAGLQALAALIVLAQHWLGFVPESQTHSLVLLESVSFRCDGTSSLMFTLISFLGWVTCQYSVRYLNGEATQGNYFKWKSFTIGAVGCMVLAADLLTFGLFWCMTSFGVHHLLLHYPNRPAAQRAAWTKFIVSRIGDVAVLLAICLYYPIVKSLQFSDLAAASADVASATLPAFQLATMALALGVIAKSAQFPFHTWLPLTMETPTPVSALMHAGIVNAGGYLLVRCSPLLNSCLTAQIMLVVIGTLTACLASMIMLTQTSIKKKLAYSTIAQMGFMLMQCGLGAYSAAMLHIVAHSLYKAHEFLSSGSIITRRAAMQSPLTPSRIVSWFNLSATLASLLVIAWCMLLVVGQNPLNKPGGWLLTILLAGALTGWIAQTLAVGKSKLAVKAWLTAVALIACYAISFAWVDAVIASPTIGETGPTWPVMLCVLIAFVGLFFFQVSLMSPRVANRWRRWQIHAANGFYIESWFRRQFWMLRL